MKIGDCEGRRFNGRSWDRDWFQPFAGEGFWGSLEPLDAHRVIGAMHCDAGIQLGVFYLNHRIDAPHVNTLSDGNALDWENRQSLFIGGDSPSRVFFRASRDDDFFYLYVDYKTCSDDFSIDMRLDTLPLTINVSGLTDAKEGIEWVEEPLSELENQNRRLKIAIPLSLLGVHAGDELRFNAVLRDQEVRDTFTFADPSDPDTWMRIRLK